MRVKDFFERINREFTKNLNVKMRDITSGYCKEATLDSLLDDKQLIDWKNAILWSWSIIGNTFVLTIEKYV
jgi:hypothetical protein